MPVIFQGAIGAVVQLDEPSAQCRIQLLGLDPDITFDQQRSIVTRVTVAENVNIQFAHMLGAHVYVYVFGDRMGQVTLSGLAFACECPSGSDLGAERMLGWYRTNRASKRKKPVRVSIGTMNLKGFVTAVTADVVDPSTSLVQWGLSIMSLPEDEGPTFLNAAQQILAPLALGIPQVPPPPPGPPSPFAGAAGALGLVPFAPLLGAVPLLPIN